jgi:Holliday junction resolvase RusA-like endonuclease
MPSRKFIIEGEFTSLNEYINLERGNKFSASTVKKAETQVVRLLLCDALALPDDCYPLKPRFDFYTKDARKDADNVDFARKFILDGMVKAGILVDDRRKFIVGFDINLYVDKNNPRVEITFTW